MTVVIQNTYQLQRMYMHTEFMHCTGIYVGYMQSFGKAFMGFVVVFPMQQVDYSLYIHTFNLRSIGTSGHHSTEK